MKTKIKHPLWNYLKNNKIPVSKFAKTINKNRSYLYLIFHKKNTPSTKLAKKISELTGIPITQLLYPEDDDAC